MQRATYRAPEYNVPHLLPHLGFPKDINLVQDVTQKGAINYLQLFQILRNLYILKSMRSFSLLSYFIIQCPNESVSTNQRPGWPSWFSDQPEKHKLVEEVDILLPVKFHKIPFSGFRGKVKNVSANQRPGRPSCFSDWPEKHKLGRGP